MVKKTSAYLDHLFLHRCVIKWGIANTWGLWGCSRLSLLNNSTTVSIADGVGLKILGIYCVWNSNQLSATNFFKGHPPHTVPVLYFHQDVIQLTNRPLNLSSADLFSGIKSNVFFQSPCPPRDIIGTSHLCLLVSFWLPPHGSHEWFSLSPFIPTVALAPMHLASVSLNGSYRSILKTHDFRHNEDLPIIQPVLFM